MDRVLGGLGTDKTPAVGAAILHDIGYWKHSGGHGALPADWDIYLKFLEMHLRKGQ